MNRPEDQTNPDQTAKDEENKPTEKAPDFSSYETLNAESLDSEFTPPAEDEDDGTVRIDEEGSKPENPTEEESIDQTLRLSDDDEGTTQRLAELSEQLESGDAPVDQTLQQAPDSEALSEFLTEVGEGPTDKRPRAQATALTPQDEAPTRPGAIQVPRRHTMMPKVPGYEMIRELGRGGMGVVYQARNYALNRDVALKMIRAGGTARNEDLIRFRMEAESVAALQHPNIVQIFEIGECDNLPYFALEFVSGGCLHDIMTRSDGMATRHAAEIVEVLARGMHFAHQHQLIHRDLKPANVLIGEEGLWPNSNGRDNAPPPPSVGINRQALKITDFGLAKHIDKDDGQTREGTILGTPSYMAPEQATGRIKGIGPAADIYALGAILYDLLASRPPFRGETAMSTLHQVINEDPIPPRRLHPYLDRDLETICLKCLEKDASKRYSSAEELADELARYLNGEPIQARATPWHEKAWKWTKRHPATATSLGLTTLLVLALIAFGFVYGSIQRDKRITEERLRIQAEKSEAKAKKRLNFALASVDEMFFGLSDQLMHHPNQQLVRGLLLEKSIEFYKDFLEENPDEPSLKVDQAFLHTKIAELFEKLGKYKSAGTYYKDALALFESLSSIDHGESKRVRLGYAGALNQYGNVLQKQNKPAEAETLYGRTIELLKEQVSQVTTENEESLTYLADGYYSRGILRMSANQLEEADQDIGTALSHYQALLEQDDSKEVLLSKLASALQAAATLEARQGKAVDAQRYLAKAIPYLRRLHQESPRNRDYRLNLGNALRNEAVLMFSNLPAKSEDRKKSLQQVEKKLTEAVPLLTDLVTDFPDVPEYRETLIEAQKALASVYGQTQEARKQVKVWAETEQQLEKMIEVANDPERFRLGLAQVQAAHASALTGTTQFDEADGQLLKSAQTYRLLLKNNPKQNRIWQELFQLLEYRKRLWKQLGNNVKVDEAYQSLIDAHKERLSTGETTSEQWHQLSVLERERVEIAKVRNQATKVTEYLESAIEHESEAVKKSPKEGAYHARLCTLMLEAGSYPKVMDQVEQWLKVVPQEKINYAVAAERLAFCAMLAELRKEPEQWMKLKEQSSQQSLDLLKKAKERNQLTAQFLQGQGFKVLRNLDEFKKLEQSLESEKTNPKK